MTTVQMLVYLLQRGKITMDQVAPQYREQVAESQEIRTGTGKAETDPEEIVQKGEETENG